MAADYNHENIRHIERHPYVRDAAVFVGSKDDVVPRDFGPDLPFMPDWIERHFDFPGYVLPFDPADYADTERLRRELGHDPNRPLLVASVGGSGVGVHLLRRIAKAFAELRKDVPKARRMDVEGEIVGALKERGANMDEVVKFLRSNEASSAQVMGLLWELGETRLELKAIKSRCSVGPKWTCNSS